MKNTMSRQPSGAPEGTAWFVALVTLPITRINRDDATLPVKNEDVQDVIRTLPGAPAVKFNLGPY
jgi:hypothetical protein